MTRWLMLVAALVFVGAAATGFAVTELRGPQINSGGGPGVDGPPPAGPIPGAGAVVPPYDLRSDPVFPTLRIGYVIERHQPTSGSSEELARTENGGRTWRLVGPFPFPNGYSQVQFFSVASGYAFGPAGLAVTHDGGRIWKAGDPLGGPMQRIVPMGNNVWATYVVCNGPPLPSTSCNVRVAESVDGGLHWHDATASSPLYEAYTGGDVLARVSPNAAYVVSYGTTGGGGLAFTRDNGTTWSSRSDPCSSWPTVDIASVSPGQLWMICGGMPVAGENASAKAVFRSQDGGHRWVAESYTGFGPTTGLLARRAPFGNISYAGTLSQLATISPVEAWIGVSGVGVLVTTDSGRNWQLVQGMTEQRSGSGVGVTFNDAIHGWAIAFGLGVWRTSDGVHWRLIDSV
ncbi:MAG: WD40/YVTN/BNR-like repeat-containing protein [Acidimicrobiales bacterium]